MSSYEPRIYLITSDCPMNPLILQHDSIVVKYPEMIMGVSPIGPIWANVGVSRLEIDAGITLSSDWGQILLI